MIATLAKIDAKEKASEKIEWSEERNSYVYKKSKKIVPDKILYKAVAEKVEENENSFRGLSQRLVNGDVSFEDWQKEMSYLISTEHADMFAFGKGQSVTSDDMLALQDQIATVQYPALHGFSADIQQGKLSEAQILARSNLYGRSTRVSFEDGRKRSQPFGTKAKRKLSGSCDHCTDCVRYAGLGWQSLEELILPTQKCQCKANCCCSVEYSTKPAQELQEEATQAFEAEISGEFGALFEELAKIALEEEEARAKAAQPPPKPKAKAPTKPKAAPKKPKAKPTTKKATPPAKAKTPTKPKAPAKPKLTEEEKKAQITSKTHLNLPEDVQKRTGEGLKSVFDSKKDPPEIDKFESEQEWALYKKRKNDPNAENAYNAIKELEKRLGNETQESLALYNYVFEDYRLINRQARGKIGEEGTPEFYAELNAKIRRLDKALEKLPSYTEGKTLYRGLSLRSLPSPYELVSGEAYIDYAFTSFSKDQEMAEAWSEAVISMKPLKKGSKFKDISMMGMDEEEEVLGQRDALVIFESATYNKEEKQWTYHAREVTKSEYDKFQEELEQRRAEKKLKDEEEARKAAEELERKLQEAKKKREEEEAKKKAEEEERKRKEEEAKKKKEAEIKKKKEEAKKKAEEKAEQEAKKRKEEERKRKEEEKRRKEEEEKKRKEEEAKKKAQEEAKKKPAKKKTISKKKAQEEAKKKAIEEQLKKMAEKKKQKEEQEAKESEEKEKKRIELAKGKDEGVFSATSKNLPSEIQKKTNEGLTSSFNPYKDPTEITKESLEKEKRRYEKKKNDPYLVEVHKAIENIEKALGEESQEAYGLYQYVFENFETLNKKARGQKDTEFDDPDKAKEWNAKIRRLDKALEKLPAYSSGQKIYRGLPSTRLPNPKTLNNTPYDDYAFSSFSKSRELAADWSDALIELDPLKKGSNFVDISDFGIENEEEVLGKRNTHIIFTSAKYDKTNEQWVYQAKEVTKEEYDKLNPE